LSHWYTEDATARIILRCTKRHSTPINVSVTVLLYNGPLLLLVIYRLTKQESMHSYYLSLLTRMHFFLKKSWRPFLTCRSQNTRPPTPFHRQNKTNKAVRYGNIFILFYFYFLCTILPKQSNTQG